MSSSKPSKWLFDIKGGRHERNERGFSVAGFIFAYVQKYFSGPLTGGGGEGRSPPSLPVDPPLRGAVQSSCVDCWIGRHMTRVN